jgi:hypothetical protein
LSIFQELARVRSLVYFSPVASRPVGGIKVFYRHTELVNDGLGRDDWRAQVFHWEQPEFACDGFAHRTAFRTEGRIDAATDFPLLPECHLHGFWRQLADHGVRYGIFVQNAYLIGADPALSAEDLLQAYRRASLILSISEDTAACVRLFAPEAAHKIVPVGYALPAEVFHDVAEKENLIAFMPRKMHEHARLVMLFLQRRLPADWRVVSIDGVPEAEVAATLRRSKVFMSFCGFEGLPMPPAEAALCGNHVVGYAGQGGREYWDPLLFTEVPTGDIRGFVEAVLRVVERLDGRRRLGLPHLSDEQRVALESLKSRFSTERTRAGLAALLARADDAMGGPPERQGERQSGSSWAGGLPGSPGT